jgi:hypothetical protein
MEYLSIFAENPYLQEAQERRLCGTPPPYQYDSDDDFTGPDNGESASQNMQPVGPLNGVSSTNTPGLFAGANGNAGAIMGSSASEPTRESRHQPEHHQIHGLNATDLPSRTQSALLSPVPSGSHANNSIETDHADICQSYNPRPTPNNTAGPENTSTAASLNMLTLDRARHYTNGQGEKIQEPA